MTWMAQRPEAERIRAKRILRNAGVDARHSFLTIDDVFTPCSLTESSLRFRRHAVDLGTRLLRETLEQANLAPQDVDLLITTSCTGYMIPSVDAYMADGLGMRPDLVRLPVTEMGCAAGASALIYAAEMLRSRPRGIAAIVNIEFPTNTLQLDNFSIDNIVGNALFSDGLACAIVRHGGDSGAARIDGWAMHQVPRSMDLLGYQLTDTGFVMNLDASLPDLIEEHFESSTRALLKRRELTLRDIEHFVIHPGGVKILDRIDSVLKRYGGHAALSRDVMRELGNMSSSTVMFILERLLGSAPTPGPALMMSFGPGFGAHQLILNIGNGGHGDAADAS